VGAAACLLLGAVATNWPELPSTFAAPRSAGLPNVVLIFLDTVRGDHLSSLGYSRRTSPSLDRIGASGIVFERAVAPAPWTLPSHATSFTGRWPFELTADWRDALDETSFTLAEHMAASGYQTAGFVANTRFASYETGLDQGFQEYDDYRSNSQRVLLSTSIGRLLTSTARLRGIIGWEWSLDRRDARDIRESFEQWVDATEPGRPFFAFLNFFDAHHPYDPPAPFAGRFGGDSIDPSLGDRLWSVVYPEPFFPDDSAGLELMARSYDESLAYLDSEVGKLLDGIEQDPRLDNTIVIVTSDHGELLGEHGLVDHGNSLYFPLVHVPLIVTWKNRLLAGTRVERPVSLRDIPATITDLTGLRRMKRVFPGTSLRRTWEPDSGRLSSPAMSVVTGIRGKPDNEPISRGDMAAVLVDSLLVIRSGDCRYELYDVDKDPANRNDLAAGAVTDTRRMSRLIDSLAPYTATPTQRCGKLTRVAGG
jgi:arylsulfatase A-like enzyme